MPAPATRQLRNGGKAGHHEHVSDVDSFLQQGPQLVITFSGRAQRSAAASGNTLQLRDVTCGLFQTLTQTSKLSPPRLLWTAQPSRPGWSPTPGLPKCPGVCASSVVLCPSTQQEKIAVPRHAVSFMPPPAASPHYISPLRPVRAYHRPLQRMRTSAPQAHAHFSCHAPQRAT